MKQSTKNISLVSFINLANLGLGVLLFLAVAVKLPKEDFGLYSLLTLLLVSFSKLIDFGSNSNFVSEFIGKSKNYLNELINFKLVSTVLVSIFSILFLYFINNIREVSIYTSFVLGLVFYGINYLLFALFQKDEEFIKASLLNFFPALVKGFFGFLIFFNYFNPTLINTFEIFSFSMLASSILLVYKFKELKYFKLNLNLSHFVRNFFLAGVSQFINESWGTISNQIIKLSKSLSDLGTFSLASKLSNVFSVISYSIYTVILTSNAKRKKSDLNYNIKESLILGSILLILAALGSLLAPVFFNLFFGNKYDDSITIFAILLFAQAFASIHKFLDNYFFVEEKSTTLFSFTISKLIIFVSLSLFFTLNYGLIGIAIADMISSIIITTATFIYIINNNSR